ncbi:MAG: hypothetical protein LAT68_10865 [Cyclobacteriaceae bacterium]|nr:hypothetical protein [Cyclobacteriaceae bacterium]MCH8516816.1 hypothetical protein [Cyclobacteriaceae bacterium]
MEDIYTLFHIINFGLFVLSLVVQVAIYPSFAYYNSEDLARWHPRYTSGISSIVAPLMLAQLGLGASLLVCCFHWVYPLIFALIIATWWITFKHAIPAHGEIRKGNDIKSNVNDLIRLNAYRTILWLLIFTVVIVFDLLKK